MALKTDFEEADFISSPFVDEIANRGLRRGGPFPDPGIVDPQKGPTAGRSGTPFTRQERAFLDKPKTQAPIKTAFTGDTRTPAEKVADKAAALEAAKRAAGGN